MQVWPGMAGRPVVQVVARSGVPQGQPAGPHGPAATAAAATAAHGALSPPPQPPRPAAQSGGVLPSTTNKSTSSGASTATATSEPPGISKAKSAVRLAPGRPLGLTFGGPRRESSGDGPPGDSRNSLLRPRSIDNARDARGLSSTAGSREVSRGGLSDAGIGSLHAGRARSSQETNLESEWSNFTAKMEEMRAAALNLHGEMKKSQSTVLSQGNVDPVASLAALAAAAGVPPSPSTVRDSKPEMSTLPLPMVREASPQRLREEWHTDVHRIHGLLSRLEATTVGEVRLREEAMAREASRREELLQRLEQRLDQCWHGERSDRRSLELRTDAQVAALQRELRETVANATVREQAMSSTVAQWRESIRQELQQHRMDVKEVHEELAKTCTRLAQEFQHLRSRPASADGRAPVTLSLAGTDAWREQIRRQVDEELKARNLEPETAISRLYDRNRLERLDEMLQREVVARQETEQRLLSTVQEMVRSGHASLEQRVSERLLVASTAAGSPAAGSRSPEAEARLMQDVAGLQATVTESLAETRRTCEAAVQAERRRCEEALCAHEQVVQSYISNVSGKLEATVANVVDNVVQRSSQGLLTTRQDVLDLRAEFNVKLGTEAQEREKLRAVFQQLQEAHSRQGALPQLQVDSPEWRSLTEEQMRMRREVDKQTERISNVQHDFEAEVTRLSAESQGDSVGRREELSKLWVELGQLREQNAATACFSSDVEDLAAAIAREEVRRQLALERATILVPRPQDDNFRKEVLASLESEAQLRKAAEDRLTMDMRGLIQEERHAREREHLALRSRLDQAEENIFADSGKREERDRDLRTMMRKVAEDLNVVKRQTGQAPQFVASHTPLLSGYPSARGTSPGGLRPALGLGSSHGPGSSASSTSGRIVSTPGSSQGLRQVITP